MTRPKSARAQASDARLDEALRAPPERREQAIDSWLDLATGAEVRRAWRWSWGKLPPWAVKREVKP